MNKSVLLSVFLIALFAQGAFAGQQCRALVLEAGGDLGSFEAGSFKAITDLLSAQEVQYDVITGISIGSINTLGLAQYAKGQEKVAAQWLVDLWSGLKRTDVYKNYPGGIVQGLLYEKGIFDSAPALNLLKKVVTRAPQRKINLGTCDLRTGELVRYTEASSLPTLIEAALASGSVPAFFPYSTLDGNIYVDGGTTGQLVDIQGAIHRCREVTSNDADIIVDTIFVQYSKLDFWSSDKKKKTMEVATRSQSIQSYVTAYRELLEAIDLYPEVNFRYFVKPSHALYLPKVPFLFNNKQMNDMIQQGYDDTKAIIQSSGPNGNAKQFYEESAALLKEETGVKRTAQNNTRDNLLNSYNKLKNSLKY